jgi:aldehyde dehydrogenase (NAD+)
MTLQSDVRYVLDRFAEMVDGPTSPFGGFKMSGFGREFGIYGLQADLETCTVYAS